MTYEGKDFYPLTIVDQVVMQDNSRLNAYLSDLDSEIKNKADEASVVKGKGKSISINYGFESLELSGGKTTAELVAAMPNYSMFFMYSSSSNANHISDIPMNGFVWIIKTMDYASGMLTNPGNEKKYFAFAWRSNDNTFSWSRLLTNILTSDDYGTTLPGDVTKGRIYYKKADV